MFRIKRNTINRAYLNTLRLIEMPHTFRATRGIDVVVDRPHVYRFIWAFRLAHIAIDAFVRDLERHRIAPLLLGVEPDQGITHTRMYKF